MLQKITPLIKGLITGLLMIATVTILFYAQKNADYRLQYLIYIFYALGIIWTLIAHSKSASFTGTFGNLFLQGFRCFIVVTLLMVMFIAGFNMAHPEFKEEMAVSYKDQLIKEADKTPLQIDTEITTFKKQYLVRLVSGSIFGYLLIGAGITAGVSALLIPRK